MAGVQTRFSVTRALRSTKIQGLRRSYWCVDRIRLNKNLCRESVAEVGLSLAVCPRHCKRFPDRAQLRAFGAPVLLRHREGAQVAAVPRAQSRLSDPSICLG